MPASHEGPITAVVLDLGNVVVGWDPSLPLADRMDRDQWQAFAQAVDFPGSSQKAVGDGAGFRTALVTREGALGLAG